MLLTTIGGVFLTQVPKALLEGHVEVEKMSHKPLGFLSGTLRGLQQRWVTVEKEVFAIMSMFRRLEFLLWEGVRIYTDHRNLAYVFDCGVATRELEDGVLAQYDYTIMYIFGERNRFGNLLSRWLNVPTVAVRAVAVFASSAPDETMSSKAAIREVQQQGRAGWGAIVCGASSFTTLVRRAKKNNEGLFRVRLGGRDVLWIPEEAKK